MQTNIIQVIAALSLFGSCVVATNAAEMKANSDGNYDIKCFVELVGGANSIYYNHDVPLTNKRRYKQSIIGTKIPSVEDNVSRVIYKVIECASVDSPFKNALAKSFEGELGNED